jgi:hypothetical protein
MQANHLLSARNCKEGLISLQGKEKAGQGATRPGH